MSFSRHTRTHAFPSTRPKTRAMWVRKESNIELSFLFVLCFNSFDLRTLFAWFLICFWNHAFIYLHISIMPSCICIFFSCVYVVYLFLVDCLVFFFLIEKSEKYKHSVCYVYSGSCVPWMTIETKFSKLYISCSLDEHLYVQLNKWALWLLFVMSKIKLSLVLNTHITLFDGKD